MIKTLLCSLTTAVALLSFSTSASAHCQIPCGIYDDPNVLADLHTHFVTIEKSANKIKAGGEVHDIARWVTNKEQHCSYIIETVSEYFLAQRLKTAELESNKDAYMKKLVLCHKTIVAAMKCKQSTKPEALKKLHDILHEFETAFAPKK